MKSGGGGPSRSAPLSVVLNPGSLPTLSQQSDPGDRQESLRKDGQKERERKTQRASQPETRTDIGHRCTCTDTSPGEKRNFVLMASFKSWFLRIFIVRLFASTLHSPHMSVYPPERQARRCEGVRDTWVCVCADIHGLVTATGPHALWHLVNPLLWGCHLVLEAKVLCGGERGQDAPQT